MFTVVKIKFSESGEEREIIDSYDSLDRAIASVYEFDKEWTSTWWSVNKYNTDEGKTFVSLVSEEASEEDHELLYTIVHADTILSTPKNIELKR